LADIKNLNKRKRSMTSLLDNKINDILKSMDIVDVLNMDYIQIDGNTRLFNLDFHRTRGSVRMTSENLLFPYEVEEARDKVIHLDFS
jgi:hypothetical protein